MYHAVYKDFRTDFPINLQVTTRDLKSHLKALTRWGFVGVTFKQLIDARRRKLMLPRRSVLLTFDDAYAGLDEHAHPVLEEAGFPYTVFVVTSLVGKTNEWDRPSGIASAPLLTWRTIKEMDRSETVSFQPHTLNHPRLSGLPNAEIRSQIIDSKSVVEDALGKPAPIFCYPYGDYSDNVARIAEEAGVECAVTTDRGKVRQSDDLLKLPRISVQHRPFFTISKGFGAFAFAERLLISKDKRPIASSLRPVESE
jgi:peptidoglycan/xylan/chitin deacetylase (PgdA/CDA1 family)